MVDLPVIIYVVVHRGEYALHIIICVGIVMVDLPVIIYVVVHRGEYSSPYYYLCWHCDG